MTLNADQERGVKASGHCLISACPGSGKTRTLASRAAWLHKTNPDCGIVAVTFTSDAASELAERIHTLSAGGSGRLTTGTFHKLAKDQLDRIGTRVKLATEAQSAELIRQAAKQVHVSGDSEELVSFVQSIKATLDGDTLMAEDPRFKVYLAYEQIMRKRGLHDFQDLLLLAVRGMQAGTVKPLQAQYLLVDEVQDADPIQWSWIDEHAKNGTYITAVGDDDQSIYAWRLACGYDGMQQFVQRTNALHIRLDTTYRCAPEILHHAGLLIRHNRHRVEKQLNTVKTIRGFVVPKWVMSRNDEAGDIADAITATGKPGEWAVLARSNALIDRIETQLVEADIPRTRLGGKSYFERSGPSLLLAMIKAVGADCMEGLDGLARASGIPHECWDAAMRSANGLRRGGASRFAALDAASLPADPSGHFVDIQDHMGQWLGLKACAIFQSVFSGTCNWLVYNVPARVLQVDLEPCVKVLNKLRGSILKRVKTLESPRKRDTDGCVTLSTLHSSKGLEFERVWIAGCDQGVIPHKDGDLEEERRLFYVGMTRAKSELYLSYRDDGRTSPSAFLKEAGVMKPVR